MASERANGDQNLETQESAKLHFSKAVACRAVYGSSSPHCPGKREVRSNIDARILPSRLSKLSVADDDYENVHCSRLDEIHQQLRKLHKLDIEARLSKVSLADVHSENVRWPELDELQSQIQMLHKLD